MAIINNMSNIAAFGTRFGKEVQGKSTGVNAAAGPLTTPAAGLKAAPAASDAMSAARMASSIAPIRPALASIAEAAPGRATPARVAAAPSSFTALPFDPAIVRPFLFPPLTPLVRTATQIANNAVSVLTNASGDTLASAARKAEEIGASQLMSRLERRVLIGEVLNDMAEQWDEETLQDFADAFRLPPDRKDVMDAIVALAVLNDPDLEEELLAENLADASDGDLANRRIVSQSPAPGERVQGPVVVMVAVEYRNIAEAEEEVQSILEQLVEYKGVKMPREAANKLRQRGE